jgi:DNA modification methylase
LPDDTWYLRPQETDRGYFDPSGDTWSVSRVCGTFSEREGWHGCQMPIGVLNRIILASSNPGDVVLDPFNGSGTTCVAAALANRKYVGIDQSDEYVAYARKRLQHALRHCGDNGKLNGNSDGVASPANGELFSIDRASRVKTATDAFGRPRIPRGRRAAKTA